MGAYKNDVMENTKAKTKEDNWSDLQNQLMIAHDRGKLAKIWIRANDPDRAYAAARFAVIHAQKVLFLIKMKTNTR